MVDAKKYNTGDFRTEQCVICHMMQIMEKALLDEGFSDGIKELKSIGKLCQNVVSIESCNAKCERPLVWE